jgi:hypothetical protein
VPRWFVAVLAISAWLASLVGLWTAVWGALRWAETTPFKGIPVQPNGAPIPSEGGGVFLCGAAGFCVALVLAVLLTWFAWTGNRRELD